MTDPLLQTATELTKHSKPRYQPIAGRVAYVVSHGQSYASNGYAIRTHGIAKALNGHGLETLCFVRPGRPWDMGIAKNTVTPEMLVDGVRYIHSRWPRDKKPGNEEQKLTATISRLVELFTIYRPQVVIAASNHEIALPALVAARQLGLPFQYEVRGFWEVSRASRDPGWENTTEYKEHYDRESYIISRADQLYTLNTQMKHELVARGAKPENIDLVPNSVSGMPTVVTQSNVRQQHRIPKDAYVLGYMGAITEYEGLDHLIEALALLKKENVYALIVGGYSPVNRLGRAKPEPIVQKLQKLAKSHGIHKQVIFTGRVDYHKLPEYFAAVDATVIPRAPLPVCELVSALKPLEYLSYGKPLIASNVAPQAEVLEQGKLGWLYEKGNAQALADTVRALRNTPSQDSQVITQAGISAVKQKYQWSQTTAVISSRLLKERLKAKTAVAIQSHIEATVSPLEEGRAQKTSSNELVSTVDVDALVQLANQMVKQLVTPHSGPVQGRVALTVGHLRDTAAARIRKLVKNIESHDLESLCCVRSGSQIEIIQSTELLQKEAVMESDRYARREWAENNTLSSAENYLRESANVYVELFREHRPELVIAAGDFTSALPAIIAAKKLSLPVIKEHLHYATAFLDEEPLSYFSQLSFAEKYTLEQACQDLANHNYYVYLDNPDSWEAFFDSISEVRQKKPSLKNLATLPKKAKHTVEYTVNGNGLHYLEVDARDEVGGNPKGIVASFRFFDSKGERWKGRFPGFASSEHFPHYQYVDTSESMGSRRVVVFSVPEGVGKVEVDVVAFATTGNLILRKAKLGKVGLPETASWLTLGVPGVHWIKAVEPYVHKEGATSLRLALLSYAYKLSNHRNDFAQLNGAIQELVELDRGWVPEVARSGKVVQLPSTDKLTIAHLHKTAYPYENTGGAIRCLNTALSQQRIGIDPYIITPVGYPRSAGSLGSKNHEVIEGIEHFRIGGNTDGLRGISLPDRTRYSTFHVAKILKSRGANVIHAASGVRGYELALQGLALKQITGLPLLYEVRSFHEHTWTVARNDVMDLEKTKLRLIKEDFCMAEADFVTTISYSMKKILIERGVPAEKIEVIPNAIDESKYIGKSFEPARLPELEGADIVVGYISNMSRREGHEYLIRAIHQLRRRSGLDVRGLLVGNGPERDNLKKLTDELGLESAICFPGEVDHSQINGYYKAIDLFVIPRIPDYAADWVTPLKPYEAMALERPIVVTDLPALKEIVGDNDERGLVAKPADVESLVEKLKSYIDDPAMRERKVKAAKDWVFSERTWSSNARRYETIYRHLVAQGLGESQKEKLHA